MSKFKNFSFNEEKRPPLQQLVKTTEKKERMTYWLDPGLIDKIQAFAHWTPGVTISSTVEQAVREFFIGKRVRSLPPDLQRKRDEAKARKIK